MAPLNPLFPASTPSQASQLRGNAAERAHPRSGWNGGERAVALALLVVASPVLLLLAGFVLLADGRPAFYRGTRLGRARSTFTMYKLRTLKRGAEQAVGGELLKHTHALAVRGGTFLRDTRLDELPQLWNVVRGEMAFLGPRPERPEVYRTQCCEIPGYEQRFRVRPGLIGSSQLFTPHGTAKRYRTLIDNGALRRGMRFSSGLGVVAFTLRAVLSKALQRAGRRLRTLPRRLRAGGTHERRRLRRVAPVGAVLRCLARDEPLSRAWRVLDLSEEALLVEGPLEAGSWQVHDFELELALDRGSEFPVRRRARCSGTLTQMRQATHCRLHVIRFQPATARSEYMLHQYFLRTSLASPRAAWSSVARHAGTGLRPRPVRSGLTSSPRFPTDPFSPSACGAPAARSRSPSPSSSPSRAKP